MFTKLKSEYREISNSLRRQGSFGNNLVINSVGSSSAYILGFLLSPILARIYPPEAYGLYALFNAFVVSLTIVSTLDYVNALLLPRSFREFISLFQLTVLILFTTFCLSTASIVLFKIEILDFFNAQELRGFIDFVPLIVLFTVANRSLELWNIRVKEFKQGAQAKVVSIVTAKVVTIIFGISTAGNAFGFIIGDLISKPITTVSLLGKSLRKNFGAIFILSIRGIIKEAKEYRDYPIYNLPANTLIGLSTQLPVYLMALFFNSTILGHFSLAVSLINAPTQLLGIAIAQVFFQKATETYHSNQDQLKVLTVKFFKRIIYIAVGPFALIAVFGDILFTWVFGEDWQLAGEFARYLSIMAYTAFISSSITSLLRILRLEKLQFYVVLAGSFALMIGLIVALRFQSFYALVITYSGISTILQLALIVITFKKIQIRSFGKIAELIIIWLLVVFVMCSLRWIWP